MSLIIEDLETGHGAAAAAGKEITAYYAGYFQEGTCSISAWCTNSR